jgi:transposase
MKDWRKLRSRKVKEPARSLSEEEYRRENERLRKDNLELSRANEILKDALGFFAKDRKR